jgi:hypothetical protein
MKHSFFIDQPSTLFVIAAGNETIDNATNKQLNMCVKGRNILTIGALDKILERHLIPITEKILMYMPRHIFH